MITPEAWNRLKLRMSGLGLSESDLDEQFIIGSGRGGQKLQKTSSCVRLLYARLNLIVKCQESRSRECNRFLARRLLCEKIEFIKYREACEEKKRQQKIRRQKARRSRRAKEKILADKRHQGILKESRKPPNLDNEVHFDDSI
jgi:protein subunit release factor B